MTSYQVLRLSLSQVHEDSSLKVKLKGYDFFPCSSIDSDLRISVSLSLSLPLSLSLSLSFLFASVKHRKKSRLGSPPFSYLSQPGGWEMEMKL